MKYIKVAEVEYQSCKGCAHERATTACHRQRETTLEEDLCDRTIWIENTDEARLKYITARLTQEAA